MNTYIMSSWPSWFKTHIYKTQADLQGMSPEQIINLEPDDVRHDIYENDGGRPLEGVEKSAMNFLLSIKEIEKKSGKNKQMRKHLITDFLRRKRIIPNPEVDALMKSTDEEVKNDKKFINDTINRLNQLGGKRKGKTVSKRKRRGKTRKGRKTK